MRDNSRVYIYPSGTHDVVAVDIARLSSQLISLASQSDYAPAKADLQDFVSNVFSKKNDQTEKKVLGIALSSEDDLEGFCQIRYFFDTADIDFIIVDRHHQRKGIAQALILSLESELRVRGVERILLEVGVFNDSARRFYFRNGFQQIAVRKGYYRSGEDALILEKRI